MDVRTILALSVVLLTCAAAAVAEDADVAAEDVVVEEEDGVAVLNRTNFDSFVGPKDLVMVEFCKNVAQSIVD